MGSRNNSGDKDSRTNLSIWLLAARPKTLLASVAPVLLGLSLAFADETFIWPIALLTLVAAVLIQIGTNYANDYYDYLQGADTGERKGPLRATQAGLIDSGSMRMATAIVFAMAVFCGFFLVLRGGYPVLIIGILSVLFGVWYTAGRYSLAYLGVADLFVFVFFGPVAVAGTYYLQTLSVNFTVVLVGVPCGLISVAILTINNLRDIDEDRQAGKKTLAVRFGAPFAKRLYLGCLILSILFPFFLWMWADGKVFALTALLTAPLAIYACKTVLNYSRPEELNKILGSTARILILYSFLFALGWNL